MAKLWELQGASPSVPPPGVDPAPTRGPSGPMDTQQNCPAFRHFQLSPVHRHQMESLLG
ncbi:hypothetical protein DPMN_159244 [Dreissena polymorpha]|uniref:Uncharacterized protein n=1 Tax=Dreissena polymorpha TaxID=45954 RepID=A0A9D4IQK4_DREPO|nr:hypothetical protein DPMN_159244 [Dreissena polymorpha]